MFSVETICILIRDYKVKFKGVEKPHVVIVLRKDESTNIKLLLAEFNVSFADGKTEVGLSFSIDGLMTDSVEKLSVVVSIDAPATDYQKSSQDIKGDAHAVCTISSEHPANVVQTLFKNCQSIVNAGNKVDIIITDYKEKPICILGASKINQFSWTETWKELGIGHGVKQRRESIN